MCHFFLVSMVSVEKSIVISYLNHSFSISSVSLFFRYFQDFFFVSSFQEFDCKVFGCGFL